MDIVCVSFAIDLPTLGLHDTIYQSDKTEHCLSLSLISWLGTVFTRSSSHLHFQILVKNAWEIMAKALNCIHLT